MNNSEELKLISINYEYKGRFITYHKKKEIYTTYTDDKYYVFKSLKGMKKCINRLFLLNGTKKGNN